MGRIDDRLGQCHPAVAVASHPGSQAVDFRTDGGCGQVTLRCSQPISLPATFARCQVTRPPGKQPRSKTSPHPCPPTPQRHSHQTLRRVWPPPPSSKRAPPLWAASAHPSGARFAAGPARLPVPAPAMRPATTVSVEPTTWTRAPAWGVNACRFSVCWPRVQPSGAGAWNQKRLGVCDRLVDGLLARGVAPHLTLNH